MEAVNPAWDAVTLAGAVTVGWVAAATTVLGAVPGVAEVPAALVTVQVSVTVPGAGAVQVIEVVPWPAVIAPLERAQL